MSKLLRTIYFYLLMDALVVGLVPKKGASKKEKKRTIFQVMMYTYTIVYDI